MFIQVFENVAGKNMFPNLAAKIGKGDWSVI